MSGFVAREIRRNRRKIYVIANNSYHHSLFAGTLEPQYFCQVLAQDYHYMRVTAECWQHLSSDIKLSAEHRNICEKRAQKDIRNSDRIKEDFLPKFSKGYDYLKAGEYLPYNKHLMGLVGQDAEILLAALIPCYVLYQEIYFQKKKSGFVLDAGNPYKAWIQQEYSELSDSGTVERLVDVTNLIAETIGDAELMRINFASSLAFEREFFEHALFKSLISNADIENPGPASTHSKSLISYEETAGPTRSYQEKERERRKMLCGPDIAA